MSLDPLRLLMVEDSAEDAELVVGYLRMGGFAPTVTRVETERDLTGALGADTFDLIICDSSLPSFDGLSAIRVIRGTPDEQPPIVVVTGAATEDAAVECIRAGADDYLLKDRPGRLAQAVRQAIERRRLQESRTVLEDSLSETEDRLSAVVQSMDDIVFTWDLKGRLTGLFGPWVAREGLNAKVFLGRSVREILGSSADDQRLWLERARRGESVRGEWSFIQAGGRRYFDYTISPLRPGAGRDLTGLLVVGRETTAVRAATKAMMDAQTEVISRLLLAAEFRDDETGDHVARMSHYCERIAQRLGRSLEDSRALQLAAEMHDVGKIAIPDNILLKPGRLTPDERAVIETHAETGYRMLTGSNIALLERGAEIALSHHEWFDGHGYPRGLAGEAIPLDGRIAAVADVFDALTSPRVYRPAFSVPEALEMMRHESGSHFDPAILQILIDEIEGRYLVDEEVTEAPSTHQGDNNSTADGRLSTSAGGSDGRARILARRFSDALRAADGHQAAAVAHQALSAGMPIPAVFDHVATPAMHRIGELWEKNAITVADEHLATAITRRVLASLKHPRHSASPGHRPTIVLATPEGEHHELGLMMAAEVLQHAGYKTIYLGADVPVAALATAVLKHDAGLLCLSITMKLQGATLERTVDVVGQACPGVQIVVGGQGLSPALLARLPVHHTPDAQSLEEIIAGLLDGEHHLALRRSDRAATRNPKGLRHGTPLFLSTQSRSPDARLGPASARP